MTEEKSAWRILTLSPKDFGVSRASQAKLGDYRGPWEDLERAHRIVVTDGKESITLKDRIPTPQTPQTPPTDRPLTAGDVPLLREGLVGICRRMADDYQTSEGDEVRNPLSGSFTTVESIGSEEPARRRATVHIQFEGADAANRAHAALRYLDSLHAAPLASPPVSERERELEGALSKMVVFNAYSAEDPFAIRLEFVTEEDRLAAANAIDRALTAQPAGEGK